MADDETNDPRVFFAAERTYLAWIRTGLALMGFGFVVARFGIFLQELVTDRGDATLHSSGLSVVLGVFLLATGVIVCLASTWRHVQIIRIISKGGEFPVKPSKLAISLALVLAVIGILMAFYLLHTKSATDGFHPKGEVMPQSNNSGIITHPSSLSVDDAVAKLQGILQQKNIQLFALIDHSGEAAKVGLAMPPTKLLIFGNPKAGTPVMLASPSVAIDLPLKLLVWEDAQGKTQISFNDPKYLESRHEIPAELMKNLGIAEVLAQAVVQ
jgi:uncharacterized membrane protein YidH (DUF202 family)/uncharacterized protein (DUF302 family)